MNRFETAACKSNEMDYSFEKNSISKCEKKCLAFRGSLHCDDPNEIIKINLIVIIIKLLEKG